MKLLTGNQRTLLYEGTVGLGPSRLVQRLAEDYPPVLFDWCTKTGRTAFVGQLFGFKPRALARLVVDLQKELGFRND